MLLLAGAILAGTLTSASAPTAEAKVRTLTKCRGHSHTCLSVGVVRAKHSSRITMVDIRRPRTHRVHARAWWSYRQPGGRTHRSRPVPVTNNRGYGISQWLTEKTVARGTRVCGKMARTKICTKV